MGADGFDGISRKGQLLLHLLRLFLLSALFWTHEWYRKDHEPIESMAAKLSAMLFDGIGGNAYNERA